MEITNLFAPAEFKVFLMILIRISVILYLFPIFGSTGFPTMAKTGFALVFTLAIFPVIKIDPGRFPTNPIDVGVLLGAEFFIGLSLGLTVRFFFGAVQLAGQIIGVQMGFSMINVVDPMTGTNVSIMEEFGQWVVMIVFLILNGHHIVISAILDSFALLPPGAITLKKEFILLVTTQSTQLFVIGIKIGAPVIAALLFTDAAFGITAKFMPQMNILIISFPLKIAIGLILFGTTFQIIVFMTKHYLGQYKPLLTSFMIWMSGV